MRPVSLSILLSLAACATAPGELATSPDPEGIVASASVASFPDDQLPPAPTTLALTAFDDLVAGGSARVVVYNAAPGARVYLLSSRAQIGTPVCPPQLAPDCLDLKRRAARLGAGTADAHGTVVFDVAVPANATLGPIDLQAVAVDGAAYRISNLLEDDVEAPELWLTLLHANDGESLLLPDGDAGGAARFVALMDALRGEAAGYGRSGDAAGVVAVTSGDNYLAGPVFGASLDHGVPFYDSLVLGAAGFDALCLGNHDFDFGPDVLADFISGFPNGETFLSANLDVSAEAALHALAQAGRIASSHVVTVAGRQVGIVGATTEVLPQISSPRDVVVNAVGPAVQAEIDALTAQGVDIIVLISHLQSVDEDLALLPTLSGVDLAVAGGGDELLANPDDLLLPGAPAPDGAYPLTAVGADGASVPVVTTSGGYRYIGRLVARFDGAGRVVGVDDGLSGPQRVIGGAYDDAVTPDATIAATVETPIQAAVDDLAASVIGTTEVALDGVRSHVRTQETNQGDLIADAFLWQARALAPVRALPSPAFAFTNGGGIRNDDVIPVGDLTELDTFDMLPFSNFLTIVPGVSRDQVKELFENAASRVEFTDGRFAQVAGLSVVYDLSGTPQLADGSGVITQPGSRVVELTLDDGTVLVTGGVVQPGADLDIAVIDFLARGGDGYPFRGLPFEVLGVSYQQALRTFIVDGLGGTVPAVDYPEGGQGRVTFLP
ncbi:MAG: 5'-nucleotidase C-terminal domain-containing protein [Alphaproteobacteria bacterium]|nr:5'-nucleotidase C-terminal domain-containing protein [Alphaproteobacteria bacterium]